LVADRAEEVAAGADCDCHHEGFGPVAEVAGELGGEGAITSTVAALLRNGAHRHGRHEDGRQRARWGQHRSQPGELVGDDFSRPVLRNQSLTE
jgi:hypothetical protein